MEHSEFDAAFAKFAGRIQRRDLAKAGFPASDRPAIWDGLQPVRQGFGTIVFALRYIR